MDPHRRLRYYASLRPWLFTLIASLAFVVIGALMRASPRLDHPADPIMAVVCMVFFGFCALVSIVFAARDRRQPVLTITPAGLQMHEMGSKQREVSWAEVTALGIRRGERWNKKSEPELYLIALGRPGARVDAPEEHWAAEDWEEMVEMGDLEEAAEKEKPGAVEANTPPWLITLPLIELFAMRKAKRVERECVALLEEIAEVFAPELDLYKITVEREIQPLRMTEDDG